MKHKSIFFVLIILAVIFFGCSDEPVNSITLTNSAAADVSVNFRGTLTDVPVGATVELTDILEGEYEYETIFTLPAGTTSYTAGEGLAGTFIMKSGTKILVVYLSNLNNGSYEIDASITSSNDLTEDSGLPNPISP